MNLLEEREARTKRRKADKKRHDSEIALSFNKDDMTGVAKLKAGSVKQLASKTARLLDEGAIEGDGWIDCFIKKGTIEKFMNGENQYLDNIDDDFEGHVDLGHMDFATFPYIIGSWRKEDLHVVDIDNGRKALDVDLHLDEDSVFVQELARQPYDIGISAEFYYHLDWESSMDLGFEVIDEILIKGYGLVGECGNVNSDGLELKGKETMKEPEKDMNVTQAGEEMEQVEEIPAEEIPEAEESMETAEDIKTEEVAEEAVEEAEVAEEAEGEEDEAEEAEEVEEADDEEGEEETDSEEVDLSAAFDEMNKQIEDLKEENAALKKQNKKLSKRLAAKNEEIEKFTSKFKGLSVSLGLTKEEKHEVAPKEEHRLYVGSDGIGE